MFAHTLLLLPSLFAAPPCQTIVRVDQLRGTAQIERNGTKKDVALDEEIVLRDDRALCFEVTGTSTALYRYDVQSEEFDTLGGETLPTPPDEKSGAYVSAIADGFKTFSVASAAAKSGGSRGGSDAVLAASRALEETRAKIDEMVLGEGGVEDSAFKAQAALVQMSFRPSSTDEIAKKLTDTLHDRLACPSGDTAPDCPRYLKVLDDLSDAYATLDAQYYDLEKAARADDEPTAKAADETSLAQWRAFRGRFVDTLADARAADDLVRGAISSKGTWRSRTFRSTWHTGQKLTLSVTPKADAKVKEGPQPKEPKADVTGPDQVGASPPPGLPLAAARTVHVRLLPTSSVHFSAGMCFLYTPNAVFSTYDSATVGSNKVVVKSGETDRRIGFALALATGWDKLDWRQTSGVAIWVPEILVNPADDGGILGVGGALSWRVVKIGAGATWIRHGVLIHHKVGDTLGTNETLQTRDGYDPSHPLPYLSISLFKAF